MASIMTLDEKYFKKNFQGSFNTCRVHNYKLKGTLFPIHKYDILHDLTHQYNDVTPSDSSTIFNIKFESNILEFSGFTYFQYRPESDFGC